MLNRSGRDQERSDTLCLFIGPDPQGLPVRALRFTCAAAIVLLAAGCTGAADPDPASDPGPTSDAGGAPSASDGGATAATVPEDLDPIPVTPAPADFTPPSGGCTGEGMHLVQPGKPADPALPERAGETLSIGLHSVDGATASLTATIGNGEPRPIDPATVGDTIEIDLWTLSVTSICPDTKQVEFDVID